MPLDKESERKAFLQLLKETREAREAEGLSKPKKQSAQTTVDTNTIDKEISNSILQKSLTLLTDTGRWLVALPVMALLVWGISVGVVSYFTWIVGLSHEWWWGFYFAFLFLAGSILWLSITLTSFLFKLFSSRVVRQVKTYRAIFLLGLLGTTLSYLYGAWISDPTFDWEIYNYNLINRIAFTILSVTLLQIPFAILPNPFDSSSD